MSLNNKSYFKSTALSKYVWEVKEAKKPFSIKWSIKKRACAYRSGAKTCYLFPKGIVNTRLTTHLKKNHNSFSTKYISSGCTKCLTEYEMTIEIRLSQSMGTTIYYIHG